MEDPDFYHFMNMLLVGWLASGHLTFPEKGQWSYPREESLDETMRRIVGEENAQPH